MVLCAGPDLELDCRILRPQQGCRTQRKGSASAQRNQAWIIRMLISTTPHLMFTAPFSRCRTRGLATEEAGDRVPNVMCSQMAALWLQAHAALPGEVRQRDRR